MATLANLVVRLSADSTGLQRGIGRAQKTISRAGQTMMRTGKTMTKGLTLPIVGAGVAAGKMAMDFESSMSRITGLVGVSQDQVSEWGDQILELGPKLGKSPRELAEAMFSVSSAGFRGSEAMDVLTSSAKASAAGLGETRSIAQAVTGAINAYGPAVLGASEATDTLVATARAGNFETSELAGSLGRVTPFAKEAGASFADVGGSISLLTKINNDARESITQVTSLMRAFSAPTKQTQKALDELGMSTEQARKMMSEKGLVGTLQHLDEQLGGNRDKLREIIPDSQGFSAALQILNADAETLDGTFGQVAEAAGMTDEAFKEAEKTAKHKLNKALFGAEGAMIKLGNAILPILLPILEDLTGLIESVSSWFQNLSGPMKTAIVIFGGLVAAAGPVLVVVGAIATAIGAITAPVLIVIGVIAAFIAIGILLAKHWDTIKGALSATWDAIKTAALFVWNALKDFFLAWVDTVRAVITAVWDAIAATLGAIWGGIRAQAQSVWNTVTAIIRVAVETVSSWIDTGKAAIQGLIDIFHAVKSAVATAFNFVARKVRGVIDRIMGPIRSVGGAISKLPFIGSSPIPMVEDMKKTASEADRMARVFERVQQRGFGGFDGATMPPGLRMQGQGGAKQEKHFHLHVSGEGPTGPTLTGFRMLQALEER